MANSDMFREGTEPSRQPGTAPAPPLFPPAAAPSERGNGDAAPRLPLPDGWRLPTRNDLAATGVLLFFALAGGVLLVVGVSQAVATVSRERGPQDGFVAILFGVLFLGPALYLLAHLPGYYLRTYTPPRPAEAAPTERYWGPVRVVQRRVRGERRVFFVVFDGGATLPLAAMTRNEFSRIPAPEGSPRPLPAPARGSESEKRLHAATVEYAPGDGAVRAIFDAQMRPLYRRREKLTRRG